MPSSPLLLLVFSIFYPKILQSPFQDLNSTTTESLSYISLLLFATQCSALILSRTCKRPVWVSWVTHTFFFLRGLLFFCIFKIFSTYSMRCLRTLSPRAPYFCGNPLCLPPIVCLCEKDFIVLLVHFLLTSAVIKEKTSTIFVS